MQNGQSVFFSLPSHARRACEAARFARVRLLRHALPISLLILRKKPTVWQSKCWKHLYEKNNFCHPITLGCIKPRAIKPANSRRISGRRFSANDLESQNNSYTGKFNTLVKVTPKNWLCG